MTPYEQIVRDFLRAIGDQADAPLEALSTDTFLAFKEHWLSGGRAPRTVNQTIKILKRPFKIALEEGLIDRNPVAAVRPIRTSSAKKDVIQPGANPALARSSRGRLAGLSACGILYRRALGRSRETHLERCRFGREDNHVRAKKNRVVCSGSDPSRFVRLSGSIT